MFKTSYLAALLVLVPIAAHAEVKAPVNDADRVAYKKMSGEQAYNWLEGLTSRTCPGVKVESAYTRETAIQLLSTPFATFDRAVGGVEEACNKAIAKLHTSKPAVTTVSSKTRRH